MSDRRWCARCGLSLPDGWDRAACSCGYTGQTYNDPGESVAAALQRDYAAALRRGAERILKPSIHPLTYNQTNTTIPVYSMTSMSNAYIPANTTIDTFIHVKKESDMNVRATALPTIGGYRGIVYQRTTNGPGIDLEDIVIWESVRVYKDKAKAERAAQRRIDEGVKAVFG